MKKYKYFMHGLKVSSEIKLYSYEHDFEDADVEICFGIVPKTIDNIVFKDKYRQYSDCESIEYIPEVGKYFSSKGNKIIVEAENQDLDILSLYIEGRSFAMILNQRNIITMHGSGISLGKNGLIILGGSGSGKSSLTTGLLEEGYTLISDDLIAIDKSNDEFVTYMGIPIQRLDNSLINKFDLESKIVSAVIYPHMQKEKFNINRCRLLQTDSIGIKTLIFLNVHSDKTELKQLYGMNKIKFLVNNLYREDSNDLFISNAIKFDTITSLASECKIYQLNREDGIDSIKDQVRLLRNEGVWK